MRERRRWWVVCGWFLAMSLPGPGAAQSTTNVPDLDPAYVDLDVLVAAGLVENVIAGERPHSRAAFRRFVEEAGRRLSEAGASNRVMEAWDRLNRRFGGGNGGGDRGVRTTSIRMDVAATRSPNRPMRPGADGDLDGVLNPLLQGNHGRVLEDGLTVALEGGAAIEEGGVAGAVVPRVYLGVPRAPTHAHVSADVTEVYGRTVLGPVAMAVGRMEVSWGHGANRGAFLSDNPRGLDMIRVGGDRPIRLPGPFAGLGLWNGSMALATMGSDRDIPGAKMLLVRLGAKPSRHVEFGLSYTNMQGGEGAPEATFWERVKDALLLVWQEPSPSNPGGLFQISDKVVGADLRISAPRIRSALYVNFLTTDDRGFFQQPAKGYTEDALWLVGVESKGLGADGRWDVHAEWRHDGARAYSHGQFTSGMTVDGRVLGEALGPNAMGVSAGLDWTGPDVRLRVRGAWERYSGDKFAWSGVLIPDYGASSTPWRRVEDNPDEIRKRLVLDYLRFEGWRGMESSVRVGYEHVTRFDYAEADRHNLLAQLSLRYVW